MGSEAGSSGRWLGVAALSATASSLLTYAVFRWRHARPANGVAEFSGAEARSPLTSPQWVTNPVGEGDCVDQLAPLSKGWQRPPRDPCDPSPRTGYLSWDDYFMAVAFLSAQRSKDPNKQVGACIVDRNNVICGIGYNGFPRGCPDTGLPWSKSSPDGDPLRTKYPYVCHAEMNAILNKNGASVAGARVFVTMFPCNECAKLMIQAGIAEIVYHEDKAQPRAETPAPGGFKLHQQYAASKLLLSLAGVTVRQHLFHRPVALHLTNHSTLVESALVDGAPDVSEGGSGSEDGPAGNGAPSTGVPQTAAPGGREGLPGSEDDSDFATAVGEKAGSSRVSPALAAVLTNAEAVGSCAAGPYPATGKVLCFDDVR